MKDWLKWAIPIGISLMITIGGWIGGYMVLKADVNNIKNELTQINLAVLANEMKNMKDQNNKLEEKVDNLTKILLEK